MGKLLQKIVLILLMLSVAMPHMEIAAQGKNHDRQHCNWHEVIKLKNDMRKLWIDHVVWTREYIKSNVGGLEDQEAVLARLLKNQKDIGNAIKPYYGEEAGNQLAALLTDHIVIAGKLVEAAKTNDQENFNKLNKDWYKNADDIAIFLSKANPKLNEKELKDFLHMHLKLVTDEVTTRLNKEWEANILAFDQGKEHMIMFADILSKGIKKQFPEKFRCSRKK